MSLNQQAQSGELFMREEAAQFLGVSLYTLKDYVYKRKDLHPFRRDPLMFTREELERYRALLPHREGRPPHNDYETPPE